MINAGLLPIQSGSFALRYPERTFFTLTKAMKEKHNSKALLFTSDRPIVWNQGRIAEQFGFDRIFSSKDWTDTDDAARKKRISDGAFLTQAVEKIKSDGLWSEGESAFLQFVTYSGHSPFTLPEKLQKMTLTKEYPEKLRDYIITSNYVDNSLGILLDYLRSRPDYKNMMIVIVGDPEGLAADRAPLCQSQAGRGLVSPKTYVPIIVVNSPVGMRYTDVMGQIDIYPTLLNLLHLDDYRWKGIGQSIVSSSKAPSAISPEMNIEGDTTNLAPSTIKHIKSSYPVSDKIIRFDYLRNDNPHDL